MRGDERFAALKMNAMMFVIGVLIMSVVAAAGALFGRPAGVGVDDAIVVTARVEGGGRPDAASAARRPHAAGSDGVARGGGS